jgi:hypothetical protein
LSCRIVVAVFDLQSYTLLNGNQFLDRCCNKPPALRTSRLSFGSFSHMLVFRKTGQRPAPAQLPLTNDSHSSPALALSTLTAYPAYRCISGCCLNLRLWAPHLPLAYGEYIVQQVTSALPVYYIITSFRLKKRVFSNKSKKPLPGNLLLGNLELDLIDSTSFLSTGIVLRFDNINK